MVYRAAGRQRTQAAATLAEAPAIKLTRNAEGARGVARADGCTLAIAYQVHGSAITTWCLSSANEHRDRSGRDAKAAMVGGMASTGRVIFACHDNLRRTAICERAAALSGAGHEVPGAARG